MSDVVGFNRAQSTYENKMTPPTRCLYGFYMGDRVEIINPFMSMWPEDDHVEKFGEVIGFDREYILVRHGSREDKFYHKDIKKLN
jgi:ribosomal protein L21E